MNLLELTKRSAFLSLFIVITFLISCENPKDIGLTSQQNPNNQIGVSFDESFDLQPQITLLDSFQTSNSLTLLVGKYKDPIFGDITAQSFTDVGPSLATDSTINLVGTNRVFQSLTLSLIINHTYGADVTQDNTPQTINLYELNDTIVSQVYTNNDVVPFNATRLIGSATFVPKTVIETNSSTVEVTISDQDYIQRFFDVTNKGGATADEFLSSLRGFAIVPAATNTVMLGFNRPLASLTMRYTSEVSTGTQDNQYSVFFLGNAFNNIQAENRPGELANLTTTNREFTGGNVLYAQSGTGIATKIDLVDVLRLKSQGAISINKAELIFYPTIESVNSAEYPIPSHLLLAQANGTFLNKTSAGLFDFIANEDNIGADNFAGNLTLFNNSFRQYTFNITEQLQQILNGTRGSQIFVMPSFTTSFSNVTGLIGGSRVTRVLIDNDPTSNRRIQLKVFYTVIKQ
ncbi:hypothetical protein BKI52_18040 [marine bacterium AO1-C]|nr:hypothetical protein BKI52_18040 [marine bacterium AO1-C]